MISFLSSISHATTQNWIWKKSLSIMIVPCNCCLLPELSVSAVLAHTFWTLAEFTEFFLSLSLKQTKHSMPSTSGFCHICGETDCFQATPTLLTVPQYVFISLLYQPFILNIVSPFPLPHIAPAWRLTLTTIKLIIFYSLRLKYQVRTVRDIPRFETEILPKMYNVLPVQCP